MALNPSALDKQSVLPGLAGVDVAAAARQYHAKGFVILNGILSPELLEALRSDCDLACVDCAPEAKGCVLEPWACYRGDFFDDPADYVAVRTAEGYSDAGGEFAVGCPSLSRLLCATLGCASPFLINEQFVVKPGSTARAELTTFAWHRDGDYFASALRVPPFASLWIALDDCTEENGCLCIHTGEGAEPGEGIPLLTPAGTAVLFSSSLWHCSGPNTSAHPRRAYMPQFCGVNLLAGVGDGDAECFVAACAPP